MHSSCGRYDLVKRAGDIIISGGLIIFLIPIFATIAVMIMISMGFPVIFRQMRPGRYGRPFYIYKFRTMIESKDVDGHQVPDSERLTDLGRWLRRSSLDELPELFNVLKGDMSLVGPRPLLMRYLQRYTREQWQRHEMKPGITGWAQVNGRNAISWEEKFKLDVWYLDNISFWIDLKILGLTALKVLKREGICYPGQATMEEFKGNYDKIIKGGKNDEKGIS